MPQTRYVGEVGLDAGPRYYRSLDLQKKIFERILKGCAKCGSKILTVHSVRATKMVLDMVERYLPSTQGQTVLHWFTGSKAEARRAVELGCYFSVNAQMMRNDRGRDLVSSLPSDRLLTETDGPFTDIRYNPARPQDVTTTVETIATLRGKSTAELTQLIQTNLKTIVDAAGVVTSQQ